MILSEPLVLAPALVAAALYARGFTTLARRMPDRFGAARLVAFMAGIAILLLAASPLLDELSHALLQAHMTQHLMLMLVAPPLLWMGAPVAPGLCAAPSLVGSGLPSRGAWRARSRTQPSAGRRSSSRSGPGTFLPSMTWRSARTSGITSSTRLSSRRRSSSGGP